MKYPFYTVRQPQLPFDLVGYPCQMVPLWKTGSKVHDLLYALQLYMNPQLFQNKDKKLS